MGSSLQKRRDLLRAYVFQPLGGTHQALAKQARPLEKPYGPPFENQIFAGPWAFLASNTLPATQPFLPIAWTPRKTPPVKPAFLTGRASPPAERTDHLSGQTF